MAAMAGAKSVYPRLPFWLEKGLVLVECCWSVIGHAELGHDWGVVGLGELDIGPERP
jgi:hypothetical protein